MSSEINRINNHSRERRIEVLYKKIMDNFLTDFFISIEDEEKRYKISRGFAKKMVAFNGNYGYVKEKFKYNYRDNGERYFNHVTGVFQIYTKLFSNVNKKLSSLEINENNKDLNYAIEIISNEIDRVIVALHHDTIEDTDLTFEALMQSIGVKNALSVLLISKPSFIDFIEDEDDLKEISKLKDKKIVNSKGTLSDNIKLKLFIKYKSLELKDYEKIIIYGSENYEITEKEEILIEKYEELKEKYKSKRNKFYFKKMDSYDSMIKYSQELNKKYNLGLDDKELEIITKNSIYIKISDRLHNLSDILVGWKNTPNKIEKKLKETEKKLYPIAKELSKKAFKELKNKVKEVREGLNNLYNEETEKTINTQKDQVDNLIK